MMKRSNDKDAVRAAFPNALTLLDYIKSIVSVNSCAVKNVLVDTDSQPYRDLLCNSLVLPDENSIEEKLIIPIRIETYPITEIVNRIVASIIRANQSYREQNCLSLGYRQKSSNANTSMRSNIDLECYFVNTIQPLVTTKLWQQLAHRIGTIKFCKRWFRILTCFFATQARWCCTTSF